MSFNPWSGLGNALEEANRQWDVQLMPAYVAHLADMVAHGYANDPTHDFEALIEFNLDFEDTDPPLTANERHAAKYVIGKVFAENRKGKNASASDAIAMREITFSPR